MFQHGHLIVKHFHSAMFLSYDSIPFENLTLSLLQRSLRFPSQHRSGTVCRARPPSSLPILIRLSADRVFTFCKSSFVILTGFVFFLSCLKKAPCFFYITQYSGRRKESYTQHISAFHQAALE